MDGSAPCYPAFALVVRLRKAYKDGVNSYPVLRFFRRDHVPHLAGQLWAARNHSESLLHPA